MIFTLKDRVGLVDLGVLIPAMKIEKESCLQSRPFGALACTNASSTVTTLPLTKNTEERSAIPSVRLRVTPSVARVTLGSGISKSRGSSISTLEPGSIGYSAPISNSSLNVHIDSVVLIGLPVAHEIYSGSTMMSLILFAVKVIELESP